MIKPPSLTEIKDPQQHLRYLERLVSELQSTQRKATEAHQLISNRPSQPNLRQWLSDHGQEALATLGIDQPTGAAKSAQAQVAPTVDDDATKGYSAHSQWINATTGDFYICTSSAPGAAVWKGPF
jgi:hypothetical protein